MSGPTPGSPFIRKLEIPTDPLRVAHAWIAELTAENDRLRRRLTEAYNEGFEQGLAVGEWLSEDERKAE